MSADPHIVNAYVTFQSMEGRARALKAYEASIAERKCYNCFCGVNLTATRLLGTDDIDVEEPMDP